jgi:hypothetical protein
MGAFGQLPTLSATAYCSEAADFARPFDAV